MKQTSKTSMGEIIPEDLKTIAAAFSESIAASNRTWVTLITVCIAAVLADTTVVDKVKFLGVEVASVYFHELSVIVISALNIHFCSCCMVTYKFSEEYAQYQKYIKATEIKISDHSNLADLAYRMVRTSHLRVFPLTFGLNKALASVLTNWLKPVIDFVYILLPVWCLWQPVCFVLPKLCSCEGFSFWPRILTFAASVMAAIAVSFSVILVFQAITWLCKSKNAR